MCNVEDNAPARIEFSDADKFLDALSPTHSLWEKTAFEWIFRGHTDATWALLPSAFRTDIPFPGTKAKGLQSDNDSQRLAELRAVSSFFRKADEQGLSLPEDSLSTRGKWMTSFSIEQLPNSLMATPPFQGRQQSKWPPRELWSILALAQHYGIPTRLLDWTRISYVAAYFAAKGIIDRQRRGGTGAQLPEKIGVWVCTRILLETEQLSGNSNVALVSVPRSGNPNLHAQHGVFTIHLPPDPKPKDPVDVTPLDRIIYSIKPIGFAEPLMKLSGPRMTLLTLPSSGSKRLLTLLSRIGYSAATLFPGFGGAAEAVREETDIRAE